MSTKQILTTVVGVPIDCAGKFTGVERMPTALRAAGLVDYLYIDDAGDLPVTIDTPERDPLTGIIGFHKVCQTSDTIRIEIGKLLRRGERPLVVGGCCTLLIGVMAALRQEFEHIGLAFVDGHLDFYDGESSPTGEAADMELAILTGFGPSGLIDLAGSPPMIAPSDIIVMGFRDAEQAIAYGAPNPAILVPEMKLFDVQALRRLGEAKLGNEAAKQFEVTTQRFWLHLDLDVLDQDLLPAVDYQKPNGLSWDEVAHLIRPLLQVHGSWQLIQTLLSHELVDEFRLWIFPVVVGTGKRLFGPDTVPTDFALLKTKTTSNGVMMSIYRRAGKT